jgi:uncharacterized protein YukE
MGDNLAGIEQDVPFNWAAASRLVAELRATAGTLGAQIGARNGYANGALEDWRGRYSREFRGRMQTCAHDASRLSSAMLKAAQEVEELARLAREEQDRRVAARAWKHHHDHRGIVETVESFFGGDHDKPPIPPPKQPPMLTAECPTAGRG